LIELHEDYALSLPSPSEFDEKSFNDFMALSGMYHRLTLELHTPRKNSAERYTKDLTGTIRRARRSEANGTNDSSTWIQFFEGYARSCRDAADAALSVYECRTQAMETSGTYLRRIGQFSDESWREHEAQAERYQRKSQDWHRKHLAAIEYIRERQPAGLP
jgi:hypothetical protein